MKAKVIIPGGSGFIGNFMANFFIEKNYDAVILTRGKPRKHNGIRYLHWDGKTLGDWANEFENAELILNLAGKSVDCCLLYTSPSPRDATLSRMPSSA